MLITNCISFLLSVLLRLLWILLLVSWCHYTLESHAHLSPHQPLIIITLTRAQVTEVAKHVEGTIYDWLNTSHLLSHLQADLPWIASAVGSDNQLHDLSGVAGIRKYHEQVTNHFMKEDGMMDPSNTDTNKLLEMLTADAISSAQQVI